MEFCDVVINDLGMAVTDKSLPEFFDYALERTGYLAWIQKDPDVKRRLANLRLLRAMTTRYERASSTSDSKAEDSHAEALGTFLADIAAMSAVEGGDPEVGLPAEGRGVTMATIHAVKGLEFPVVFLSGLEEGIFPHVRAIKTAEGMEEETRLAYVAMTRAMSLLYLTYARSRVVGEEMKEHSPSRFLAAIPKRLTVVTSAVEHQPAMGNTLTTDLHPIEVEPTMIAVPTAEACS